MDFIYCSRCGNKLPLETTCCPYCNTVLQNGQFQTIQSGQQPVYQTIHMALPASQSNSSGTAGLVLAILGLLLGWIPFLGWPIWLLGLLFSIIGLYKRPKGCAVAGLIISCIDLLIILIVISVVGAGVGVLGALFS